MQHNITNVLKAIADPTRREIFHALVFATTAMPITQISNQFEITRQGVTKHIKTLEDAGLVKITKNGRERYCFADATPLKEVNKWLNFYEKFWDDTLNMLDSHLGSSS